MSCQFRVILVILFISCKPAETMRVLMDERVDVASKNKQSKLFLFQADRYNKNILKEFSKRDNFYEYKFLGNYFIDRYKRDEINLSQVQEGLSKLFPNVNSHGYLCLDIENEHYQNLKYNKTTRKEFINSRNKLIGLIDYVKNQRPNLKISLYGLPFSFTYKFQEDYNNFKDLEPLLSRLDFISPAIYLKQNNEISKLNQVDNYVKSNLKLVIDYGQRLNKPVYPYVWYLIHPSNKKYRGQLIREELLNVYLQNINNYSWNDKSVDGVIWWESSVEKIMDLNNNQLNSVSKNDLIELYSNLFN